MSRANKILVILKNSNLTLFKPTFRSNLDYYIINIKKYKKQYK